MITIDKSKTYYKVTNRNECHNELQYRTGIVKDICPFNDNPNAICTEGRMYFTDADNLVHFLFYGENIRPIKLLPESKVIVEGNKAGTDTFEMLDIITLGYYFENIFNKETFDFKEGSWALGRYCSNHFDKWFSYDKYNFEENSWALVMYCPNHFDKWFSFDKYNFEEDSWALVMYCPNKKHIWGKYVKQIEGGNNGIRHNSKM
jgi:hypothetical protein